MALRAQPLLQATKQRDRPNKKWRPSSSRLFLRNRKLSLHSAAPAVGSPFQFSARNLRRREDEFIYCSKCRQDPPTHLCVRAFSLCISTLFVPISLLLHQGIVPHKYIPSENSKVFQVCCIFNAAFYSSLRCLKILCSLNILQIILSFISYILSYIIFISQFIL